MENANKLVPDKLETVVIDIPNGVFTINGKPFGTANEFHLSFENGVWHISVYLPHKYQGTWGRYDVDGTSTK